MHQQLARQRGHRQDYKEGRGGVGRTQDGLETLLDGRLTHKVRGVMSDVTHPLRRKSDDRLFQRIGRLRVPRARTASTPIPFFFGL